MNKWCWRAIHVVCDAATCFILGSWAALAAEIVVSPTSDLASLAAESPPGSIFVLLRGKHYSGDIRPKDRQTFVGMTGAVLSGAVRLSSFVQAGAYWKAQGASPLTPSGGTCRRKGVTETDACLFREDLFADDVPLARVRALEQLRPGAWYQDRTTGEVYLSSNPEKQTIEMSYRPIAFYGSARDVTIRGLTIQQYASAAQHGAVHAFELDDRISSSRWSLTDNIIRFNSGTGVRTGDLMVVRSNQIKANGQLGIGGPGENVLVDSNEITGNNTHGFSPTWEAGGTKFVRTQGLVFRGNCVRDNDGPGIWTDIENVNSLIVGNTAVNNAGVGIFHEVSGRALIANNLSALNGTQGNSPWSSQILISGSIDTLVWKNLVRVARNFGQGVFVVEEGRTNENRRIHDFPQYVSRGNLITQNQITFDGAAGVSGFENTRGNVNDLVIANRFEENEIAVAEGTVRRFRIGNETMDLTDARDRGQELRSRIIKAVATDHIEPSSCVMRVTPAMRGAEPFR